MEALSYEAHSIQTISTARPAHRRRPAKSCVLNVHMNGIYIYIRPSRIRKQQQRRHGGKNNPIIYTRSNTDLLRSSTLETHKIQSLDLLPHYQSTSSCMS